jgi:glycosyltransferase involved in cell wall biosynthesis
MNKTVEQRLSGYPNVKFMPPVKPNEVPGLLQKCDVGLIPYICNEYSKNIYPLKINEYLSVGVPVVLTSFADLPEFNEIVSFTTGKESFCEAIVRAIESDNLENIMKRIQFAEMNSWENRAELFGDLIDKFLGKKTNC